MDVALVDRSAEREALGGLLARAADGYSGALVLRGEAGVGKTALLDETVAAAAAAGMQTARLTGVEPETQLGYAGLHRFLLPFADQLEQLPAPQRDALRSTFGLVAGPPADRFLVALAVLTLLAEVASAAPLVCVVDDVQWLDPESAVVLGFVARRLYAEQVVLLFAVREPAGPLSALAGLPELAIGGLDDDAALELLASLTPGPLSPAVGARIVAETGGNPLALVEVARELSPGQLAGSEVLPEPLPVGGSLEKAFGRRVSRLPPEARLLLAVAAAEPTASQALLWRAAGQLGIDPDAAASADLGDLAEIGSQVEFRHPLIRSVAYHATPLRQRRRIHQALAAVGDGSEQPDRVAWHLGMAAVGPDEAVAARLEQAAGRARDRGGYAATVTFLSRAAELSAEEGTARPAAARGGRGGADRGPAGPGRRAAGGGDAAARRPAGPRPGQAAARHDPLCPRTGGRGGTGPAGGGAGARAGRPARCPRGAARGGRGGAVRRLVRKPGGLVRDSGRGARDAGRCRAGGIGDRPAAGRLRRPGGRRLPGERAAVPPRRRHAPRRRSQPAGGPAPARARLFCGGGAMGRPGPARAGHPLGAAGPRPWGADRAAGSAQQPGLGRGSGGPVRRCRGLLRRGIRDLSGHRESGRRRDGRRRGSVRARLARSRDGRAPGRGRCRPRGDQRRPRCTEHLGSVLPGRARARPGQLPGGAAVRARRL